MLAAARFRNGKEYTVPRLLIYDHVIKAHGRDGVITTGFFSRIVGDMKRTGIIGTAKGGEVLFLTNAYWKLSGGEARLNEFQQRREKLAIEILHLIEAAPRTREYFRDEDQAIVDDVLQFFCDRGDIKIENGFYRLSDKVRAGVDAEKAGV